MADSGNITVERAISIQSFKTPATRMVTAPVLPITKNMEKFNASAHRAFEKNVQKLNWIWEISIPGFSNMYHGANRKRKLQTETSKYKFSQCCRLHEGEKTLRTYD